jgi:hypothetical protein
VATVLQRHRESIFMQGDIKFVFKHSKMVIFANALQTLHSSLNVLILCEYANLYQIGTLNMSQSREGIGDLFIQMTKRS